MNQEDNPRNRNQVSSHDFEPPHNQGNEFTSTFDPRKYLAGEMLSAVERNTTSWFDKWKCNFT
jgi:hypothetical protein